MTIWERFSSRVRDAMDTPGGPGSRNPAQPPSGLAEKLGLTRISDEALGAELERRRRARGKNAHRRPAADDELDAMSEARRARRRDQSVSKAYAVLEIPLGAPRQEIDRAFRTLLRQYHPDRHIGDDEQHKSAVALATSLSDSYVTLLQLHERR
jgi:DnaJ-domain-containing protein 1